VAALETTIFQYQHVRSRDDAIVHFGYADYVEIVLDQRYPNTTPHTHAQVLDFYQQTATTSHLSAGLAEADAGRWLMANDGGLRPGANLAGVHFIVGGYKCYMRPNEDELDYYIGNEL